MHLEMVTSPADEQNLRTSTEKQNEVSPPIINLYYLEPPPEDAHT